jgi:hypothetical protein
MTDTLFILQNVAITYKDYMIISQSLILGMVIFIYVMKIIGK